MTAVFKRTEKKFNGFSQADMVEFLIDERKLSMMKLDYIWSHMSTTLTQRNCSMLCHKEWLAPSTTLPHKMAGGIRRTV